MIMILVLFALSGGAAIGYSIGRWGSAAKTEEMLERRLSEFRINEQARLLAQSREAHYNGEVGMADLLAQAAERVMLPEKGKR